MQFYALLALTLAASASARLSQRTLASRDDVDQCAIDCTTKYLVSDAYKNTACDIKKDKTCLCTDKPFVKAIAACIQANCSDLVDESREENISDCKALKLEFDTDAFDAGVTAGKEAAKESASKSESSTASSTKTSAASASETADDKVEAATTTAASDKEAEEKKDEENEDEDNAASRSTLGMMGVLVVAVMAGAFVV